MENKNEKTNKIALGLATLLMGLGGNAMAATETASVDVSSSVLPSCNVKFPGNVNLVYNPTVLAGVSQNNAVNILCTKTTLYSIGFSGEKYNRYLKFGENLLKYSINKTGLGEVGDIGSGSEMTGIGTGKNTMIPMFVKIIGGNYVPAGTYSDEVVMTVEY